MMLWRLSEISRKADSSNGYSASLSRRTEALSCVPSWYSLFGPSGSIARIAAISAAVKSDFPMTHAAHTSHELTEYNDF